MSSLRKIVSLRGDLPDKGKEAALIRRAAAGDRDAFEDLLTPYETPLLRYVARLLGPSRKGDVADLTQAIFIRVIESIGRVDAERPFRPFLYRVATNLVIDHVRQEGRRGRFFTPGGDSGPEKAAAPTGEPEDRLHLRRALSSLPIQYQTVLVLRVSEGLDYAEISETLQIPVNTVRTYLFRARSALRRNLEAGK